MDSFTGPLILQQVTSQNKRGDEACGPSPAPRPGRARIGLMRRLLPLALVLVMQAAAREPVRARHGMVTAQEPLAADVGVEVMKKGGNAIDAAIAVGFALAVTHP